jgi:hypothetical protein
MINVPDGECKPNSAHSYYKLKGTDSGGNEGSNAPRKSTLLWWQALEMKQSKGSRHKVEIPE